MPKWKLKHHVQDWFPLTSSAYAFMKAEYLGWWGHNPHSSPLLSCSPAGCTQVSLVLKHLSHPQSHRIKGRTNMYHYLLEYCPTVESCENSECFWEYAKKTRQESCDFSFLKIYGIVLGMSPCSSQVQGVGVSLFQIAHISSCCYSIKCLNHIWYASMGKTWLLILVIAYSLDLWDFNSCNLY